MQEKQCTKCKIIKPVNQFRVKDGKPYCYCKQCEIEASARYFKTEKGKAVKKKHEDKYRDEINARRRAYDRSPQGRAKSHRYNTSDKGKQYQKIAHLRHPEKRKARDAVNNAVKVGKLKPAKDFVCTYQGCTKQAQEYHHYLGYEYPLEVRPVCIMHHRVLDNISKEEYL